MSNRRLWERLPVAHADADAVRVAEDVDLFVCASGWSRFAGSMFRLIWHWRLAAGGEAVRQGRGMREDVWLCSIREN